MKFVPSFAATLAAVAFMACGTVDANSQSVGHSGASVMNVGFSTLMRNPATPFLGAEDADITIISYMDYNCQYCKKMIPEIEGLLAADPKVRILYKEWPIFGAVSENASRMALAAVYQGKYHEIHKAFMSSPTRIDSDETARRLASAAGVDMARLDADLEAHRRKIDAVFRRNALEAAAMSLHGTPAFVINGVLIPGGIEQEQFQEIIRQIRAGAL